MLEEFLWTEKYRPKTISDTILPKELKKTFQAFVDQGNIPNMILAGASGLGKTTVARALLEELGCDYIIINSSMNGNIDTLRNEIQQFASTISFTGTRKYVILDEADGLNPQSTQPSLRNFMEEFSKNCGFILTCNLKNRIIPPLHGRCAVIDFVIPKAESAGLALLFFKRIENILSMENITYDKNVVITLIQKFYPDWRRIITELQRYSACGSIDSGILSTLQELSIKEIMGLCKEKKFDDIRKWVHENSDQDANHIFRAVYDNASIFLTKRSIPALIILIADYQYKLSFSANSEICLVAFFVEMMMTAEFI